MTLIVKKLNNAIPSGTQLPITSSENVGNKVGLWAEKQLKQMGFPINHGKGPDLNGMEIKTRKRGTTSAMSIGSMTTEDIISTPWAESSIREKCQRITLTNWDADQGQTINNETIDLTSKTCQSKLEESYEKARQAIANGETDYTKDTGDVYFERKSGNTWQLRASAAGLKKMKDRAWSEPILSNKELFPDA